MIDSCSPSKLEPGLAATYSMPRLLITSTIKSDAGFPTRRGDAARGGGSVSARSWAPAGAAARAWVDSCAAAAAAGVLGATSAAAPAAAPFRKRRRPTEDLLLAT